MPVEIRELVIRTTVTGKKEGGKPLDTSGAKKDGKSKSSGSNTGSAGMDTKSLSKLRESILQECMFLISEHLSNRNER